ncbi:MAG: hypothetical protein P4L53_03715 [Candidatus Obscuribacterales bacterium]|nr:hypothetical protein [Candidatus Obscuribacterales bacterium]
MNINFVGMIGGAILGLAGLHYNLAVAAVLGTVVFVICWIRQMRINGKQIAADNAKIKSTGVQLRSELTAVHHLAIANLGPADEATRSSVIELLVEAGKHLGNPYTYGRLAYGGSYFLAWNLEGLTLVAQAKKLIEDSQPKA